MKRLLAVVVSMMVFALWTPSAMLGASVDTSLNKAEFQRRANAICRTYTRKIRALKLPMTRAVVERWASLLKAQERQLAALTPPATHSTRFRRMLAAGRAIPPLVLAVDAAQRAGDPPRVRRLEKKAVALADQRTRLANGMGLTVCGAQ